MALFKKLFSGALHDLHQTLDDSIQQVAMSSALNRRRNTRILYPHIGAIGGLPDIYFQNQAMRAADISLGGICIIDERKLMGEQAGQDLILNLRWQDFSYDQKASIVGVNLNRRHIQFHDVHPEFLIRLNALLKPGFIGGKFRKVGIGFSKIPVDAAELWLGPTGESLIIINDSEDPDLLADMVIERAVLRLRRDSIPVYKERAGWRRPGQRVTQELLMDMIICLANIKNPSHRVLELIELLPEWLDQKGKGQQL